MAGQESALVHSVNEGILKQLFIDNDFYIFY